MRKNSNSWHLIAMFFAIAVLFALGPVQGSPASGYTPEISCAFDVGPPAMQPLVFVNEAVQPMQISRGVSVPLRVETIAVPEIVVTTNYFGIIYISNTNLQQDLLVSSIDRYDASVSSNTIVTNASSGRIHLYRAREKI